MPFTPATGPRLLAAPGAKHTAVARGLLPATTRSAHWLSHPQFFRAVADYLAREQAVIDDYREALGEHSPFKKSVLRNH